MGGEFYEYSGERWVKVEDVVYNGLGPLGLNCMK